MIALFSFVLAWHVSSALKIHQPGAEIGAPPLKGSRILQQESLLRQYISQSLDFTKFENSEDNTMNRTRLPRLHLTKRAAERLLTQPPRYMFGISTGHSGTTSLSNAQSYSGSFIRNITFRFEMDCFSICSFINGWPQWAATQPSLEEQERKVRKDYKIPIDDLLDHGQSSTYVDLGHHNLHGILRTTPKVFGDDVFLIRIRRDRVHTAYSYSIYNRDLCKNWFRVCPLTDWHLLSPRSGKWTEDTWRSMTHEQQHLWFVDEVEAEFQQLLRENPHVSYLGCNWSDNLGPCFEVVSSILGLQVANGGAHLMHHTSEKPLSREDRTRIVQADEDYRRFMEYTDEVRNLISEVQF